jgi:hypothetical protein
MDTKEIITQINGASLLEIMNFLGKVENLNPQNPAQLGKLAAEAFLLANKIKHFGVKK